MQVKQLEYVREVAQQGSVKHAAEKLYISQQALSESIRSLEAELEFKLFQRTNRGIIPTEKCEKILQDIDIVLPILYSWAEYKEKPVVKLLVQYALSDLLVDSLFMQYLTTENQVDLQYETLNLNGVLEETAKSGPCLSIITTRERTDYSMLPRFRENGKYIFEQLVEQERSQMCILMHADTCSQQTGDVVDLKKLKGRTLVVNKDQIKLDLVEQITEHTEKPVHGLPYTVKPIDIVAQNRNAITFSPKFIADENFYVKNGILVSCPMLQCMQDDWRTYLFYDKRWEERLSHVAKELKMMFNNMREQ